MTQEEEQKRIASAGWDVPSQLHFVPVDFTKNDLTETLLQHGYNKEKKTFFSWLVSYYLAKEQVETMLQAKGAFAAEGSSLLFDYASYGIIAN